MNIPTAIKLLHARKDLAYGGAWKRRGEQISVVPNIARKVDRLTAFLQSGTEISDEHILETAIDLYVYSTKYLLFLAERHPELVPALQLSNPIAPLTDHNKNFDELVDREQRWAEASLSIATAVERIASTFESLWPAVEARARASRRFDLATELADTAQRLVIAIAQAHPGSATSFVERESVIRSR